MKKGSKTAHREHINNRKEREQEKRERQSKNDTWRREKAEREEDEITVKIPRPEERMPEEPRGTRDTYEV